MIHLLVWLGPRVGWSFALFLYLALGVVLYFSGVVGRSVGVAVAVTSVLWWLVPGAIITTVSLYGIGLLITGVVVLVGWAVRRAVPTDADTYRAAVVKARAGDHADLDRWWQRRTGSGVANRVAAHLPAWLRLGNDGIDWDEAATPIQRPRGERGSAT